MPRIVILRFDDETIVDLVETDNEGEAVGQVFEHCVCREGGIELLPLMWAKTCEIPIERIRELAGELPPPTVEPVKRPRLPIAGLVARMREFGARKRAGEIDPYAAADPLVALFEHYGIDLDVRVDFEDLPLVPFAPTADQLFEALKHGDERHQRWLREAIDAVYAGKAAPPPVEHGIPATTGMKPPAPARVPTMEEIELMDRAREAGLDAGV